MFIRVHSWLNGIVMVEVHPGRGYQEYCGFLKSKENSHRYAHLGKTEAFRKRPSPVPRTRSCGFPSAGCSAGRQSFRGDDLAARRHLAVVDREGWSNQATASRR